MKSYTDQFPALYQFLGGYFNQDWKEFYDWQDETPNFEAVVRYYKSVTSPTVIAQVLQELQEFLGLPLSDEELEEIVNQEFLAWYTPRSRGLTKRQWLEAMLPILQEPTTPSNLRFIG
jgi:hypothetical protein